MGSRKAANGRKKFLKKKPKDVVHNKQVLIVPGGGKAKPTKKAKTANKKK